MTQSDGAKDLRRAAAEFRRRYYGPRGNPGPPPAMAELAPEVMELVDSVIYGEIYNRPAVNLQTRSLCTIAALTVLGHSPELIRRHIQGALHIGVTKEQISEIISQMVFYGGMPAAVNAFRVAKETFDDSGEPWPERSEKSVEGSGPEEPVAADRRQPSRPHQSRPPINRSPSARRSRNQRPGTGHPMGQQSRGGRPGQRGRPSVSTRPPKPGSSSPGRKRNPGKRR